MNVHEAITKHSQKQHGALKRFLELDHQREQHIAVAVDRCKHGRPFSVEEINQITKEMIELGKKEIVPQRRLVTEEMVRDYVKSLKS